jgi:ADP-ribose pyrophosphatase YjhB (NUDIX family)
MEGSVNEAHTMLVFSNPVPGQEGEYLDWYIERHLDEVVSIEGVALGRFFEVVDQPARDERMPWRYLARYRLSDEPAAVLAGVYEANASGAMEIPEWITDVGAWIFKATGSPEVPADADWGVRDEPTLFVFSNGDARVQGDGVPTGTFEDAGAPFDPAYPSPWSRLSTFAVADAEQAPGVTGLAAAAYKPLTPAHTK